MINEKLAVPLSPPTSPRMSNQTAKTDDYTWQQVQTANLSASAAAQPHPGDESSLSTLQEPRPMVAEESHSTRPLLTAHKSFPYSLGPSSRLQDDSGPTNTSAAAFDGFAERVLSQGPQPTTNSTLPQTTFGGSAPTSPVDRLTPSSPKGEPNDLPMDDDVVDYDAAEQEEEGERPPKTAAELRAQKRKMKRFRLTHNQTRFLMSEFARQAHPDAAHRERLSREIPGLSPRQVQVWFQNRRAKLKRLTTDDRDRMMRSRALPVGFDMTQALHSPFGATTPTVGTPNTTSGTFPPFTEPSGVRPLTLDTLRRVSEYGQYGQHYANPSGVTPALGAFAFTPPQSATETNSPSSFASNTSPYTFQTQESPRRNPHTFPISNQVGYAAQVPQVPRLQMHDRLARSATEMAGSPLRTSVSYSALGASAIPQSQPERSQSISEYSSYTHQRRRQSSSAVNPNASTPALYGLGFSYAQMPNYQQSEQTTQPQTGVSSQTNIDANQYRRNSSHLAGPPITQGHYSTANFSTAQLPQYSQYSQYNTGYVSQQYQAPYQQQQQQPADQQTPRAGVPQSVQHPPRQTYTPVSTTAQQFMPPTGSMAQSQAEPGDNSDGGVPVGTTY